MVIEVLSLLIQHACDMKRIEGVQMNLDGPIISHIFFTDDILIFLKSKKKTCRNLVQLIYVYCSASGQQVNLQKSSVFFEGNVPVVLADELTSVLGMDKVNDPGLYLGVPAI